MMLPRWGTLFTSVVLAQSYERASELLTRQGGGDEDVALPLLGQDRAVGGVVDVHEDGVILADFSVGHGERFRS